MKKLLPAVNFSILLLLVSLSRVYAVTPIPDPSGEPGYTPLDQLETLFANLISVAVIIGAFLAFAMIIAGGFRYIIARGDEKAIDSARSTITWAVLGLVLIIGSWLILSFVSDFTGIQLTRFCIADFPAKNCD